MTCPAQRTRRMKPWLWGAGAVVVIAAVVATLLVLKPDAPADAEAPTTNVTTEQVTRGDLTERVRAKGKLAYTNTRDLGSSLPGVVTGLPDVGATVAAGQPLFHVNNEPVILMHGSLPVWRPFVEGMSDGPDVKQLEQNLANLGFFTATPDETFNWRTMAAIGKWQKSLGLERTMSIEEGRIVFAPTDLRVSAQKAAVGDPAGPALVTVSDLEKRVNLSILPAQSELAEVGAAVKLQLPDGSSTEGTVASVGAPVEEETPMGGTELKIPVQVTVNDPAVTASLNNVTVTMILVQVKKKDALLIPVTALLAQPNGGFAVEVVSGKGAARKTTLTPVELGVFADGQVEVTDGDLTEGDTVVVSE